MKILTSSSFFILLLVGLGSVTILTNSWTFWSKLFFKFFLFVFCLVLWFAFGPRFSKNLEPYNCIANPKIVLLSVTVIVPLVFPNVQFTKLMLTFFLTSEFAKLLIVAQWKMWVDLQKKSLSYSLFWCSSFHAKNVLSVMFFLSSILRFHDKVKISERETATFITSCKNLFD